MSEPERRTTLTRIPDPTDVVVYREATPGDLPRIAELDSELYPVEGGWPLEDFEEDFASPASYYLVATVGDEIVGYAACNAEDGHGELTMNTVVPGHRGTGIGRELLVRRLAWLDERTASVELQTRVDNHLVRDTYLRHGFRTGEVIPDYYGEGADAVVMRRRRPDGR